MYRYEAVPVKVVDADTIDFDIDLGFYMTARIRCRLARIDAYEIRGEERPLGLIAKKFVEDALSLPVDYVVETEKTGKYGRWIAEVTLPDGHNLSDLLVEERLAEYVDYG